MSINVQTRIAIEQHAIAEYPRECCGLVVVVDGHEVYWPCNSLAKAPTEQFIMAPNDYANAEDHGQIVAVVHSHPDHPARPSIADRVACETSGLPWYIQEVRKIDGSADVCCGELFRFDPCGYKAPLLERPFFHAILDCGNLIIDFFDRELGITVPDFPREDNWWKDPNAEELYLKHYAEAGFCKLPEGATVQYGDVFLMQLRSKKINHSGVYLGDTPLKEAPNLARIPNAMLHHVYGRPSERVVYGGFWADITHLTIRHKEMM